MTNNDFKKLLDEALKPVNIGLNRVEEKLNGVDERLNGVEERLNGVGNKLDILWEQMEKVTGDVEDIRDRLNTHTNYLKKIDQNVDHNSEDTKKLNKRLRIIENQLGTVPSPELTITD